MTAWNDPFGERIRANVRQCDKCGAELDEGDNAYFTGLDMLCLDCAEAEAKAQAQQDTVETIQTRFHAMEQRGLTRRDIDALYDLLQDVVGDETPLVITMARPVAAILDMSSTLSKSLSVMDFKQGDVTVKVKSLNGEFPIIRVGSGRMKTSYQFYDGTTSTQEKGGFAPAEDAQDINWIISPRTAPIAVSRTDKVRIFDPETYQKKRAWATDYRKYHDLWVPDNKLTAMWVNIKQAKAGGGGG